MKDETECETGRADGELCSQSRWIWMEFKTEKIYIDVMLAAAGRTKGKDWLEECAAGRCHECLRRRFCDYASG